MSCVHQVITLSDLECDYLNAQQCCNKLNKVSVLSMPIQTIESCLHSYSSVGYPRTDIVRHFGYTLVIHKPLVYIFTERTDAVVDQL